MNIPLRIDDSQREDDDPVLYKRLLRDVCYLFHELADYRHIMGDLDYANDYELPYWNLVNRVDTGRPDDRLIRSGILILFLAMLHDEFDGSGCRISKYADSVLSALTELVPEDNDILRLSDCVCRGLELLRSGSRPDDRFDEDSTWAYSTFVQRYFEDSAG